LRVAPPNLREFDRTETFFCATPGSATYGHYDLLTTAPPYDDRTHLPTQSYTRGSLQVTYAAVTLLNGQTLAIVGESAIAKFSATIEPSTQRKAQHGQYLH
jgi:hypothetical protein